MTPRHRDHGITEFYTIVLIIVLICIGVALILSVSSGFVTVVLQKPPVFAVQAKASSPLPGKSVITLYHLEGDPIALVNQSATGSSAGVFFTLESPDGVKVAVHPSPGMGTNLWTEGGTATIYYDGSRFWVADNLTSLIAKNGSGGITDIPSGIWIIYITDQQTQVVVNSLAVTV
ncbi:hypothetical protein [Methanoregula sp.]|uniref:hypothetical protein n=1 Tax=Methanoregula sp. TaxID=2052170 RepID=UPI002CA22997|nr:hypothetical protein [Methanoregula sp.]HVP95542.1 hypothetical protein [Methanoregula sp.]